MQGLQTIILAAGKGTRMKSRIPKILHPVCGKPIIQYVLEVAKAIGSLKTWVVVGHQNEDVKKQLGHSIQTVVQRKLLGTADAVKCVHKKLKNYNGDIVILCGDTPMLNKGTIKKLVQLHKRSQAACTVLSAQVNDPTGYGRIIRDFGGNAIAIREDKDASDEEKMIQEINVGAYCFRARDLFKRLQKIRLNPQKKEYYLTDIVSLIAEDSLKVETLMTDSSNEGLGINTKVDLAYAESVIRQRILKDFMLAGVTIVDPQTTYIAADAKIGQDTMIRPFSVIESDVKIGNHCLVGPFARLRPGTRIGNHVEVGNFAEISRTVIGDHCFVKHFSFLGDANIGGHVNIGAGVVTANFDGKNKNKTRILDGAFIGSDSILVAPVEVGKRAVTGAGCVVPKGKKIPADGVVIGVPARAVTRRKRL